MSLSALSLSQTESPSSLANKNVSTLAVARRHVEDDCCGGLSKCAVAIIVLVAAIGAFFVLPIVPALVVIAVVLVGGGFVSSAFSRGHYTGYHTPGYAPQYSSWSWAPFTSPSYRTRSDFAPAPRPVVPGGRAPAPVAAPVFSFPSFSFSMPSSSPSTASGRVAVGTGGTTGAAPRSSSYATPTTGGPGGARVPVGTFS